MSEGMRNVVLGSIASVALLGAAGIGARIARPAAVESPAQTPPGSCHSQNYEPDPSCTPGAADPAVTQATIQQTICTPGYTRKVRPPVSVTEPIKRERLAAYGVGPASDYELDHLIPLEAGGAPRDLRNLWPEPWNGPENAHIKDSVENAVHAAICNGSMSLADGQHAIATDWLALCKQLQPDPRC